MKLLQQLDFQNIHWQHQLFPTPAYERHLLKTIWHDRTTQPLALLTGPRRIGKSVILKQLINKLIKEDKVSPKQILFFEFSPSTSTESIWDIYSYYRTNIADQRLPMYLFFDEVQYVRNYESTIKNIYDNAPNTKIFLTGSLSLSYKKKIQESLAGRFFTYRLFPLNFLEYLELFTQGDATAYHQLQNISDRHQRLPLLNILSSHFPTFLEFGRYPELSTLNTDQSKQYLDNIVNQSLNQDVFAYFDIQKPLTIQALFAYLRENNGGIVSTARLSSQLGVSAPTVTEYLNILELMGLIYPLYNTLNPLIKGNVSRKIYINSSLALQNTHLEHRTALGLAAESYVLEQLLTHNKQITFWRKRNKEIDFILPQEKIGYEVKYRTTLPIYKNPLPKYRVQLLSPDTIPSLFLI